MSGPLGANLMMQPAGVTGFYSHQILNSVRFDDNDSSYLSKTWGASATNDDRGALSMWFKRGNNINSTTNETIISTNSPATNKYEFNSNNPSGSSDALIAVINGEALHTANGGGDNADDGIRFRDPTAWTHFVVIYNSDDSTADDRHKLYINGSILPAVSNTTFWDNNGTNTVNSGADFGFMKNGSTLNIGRNASTSGHYYDGLLAEIIGIDGAASISDFGETKNGVWIPKNASGLTFGTNGFYLKFGNSGSLGTDSSGNSNTFTVNNMGADHQLIDSPTNGTG